MCKYTLFTFMQRHAKTANQDFVIVALKQGSVGCVLCCPVGVIPKEGLASQCKIGTDCCVPTLNCFCDSDLQRMPQIVAICLLLVYTKRFWALFSVVQFIVSSLYRGPVVGVCGMFSQIWSYFQLSKQEVLLNKQVNFQFDFGLGKSPSCSTFLRNGTRKSAFRKHCVRNLRRLKVNINRVAQYSANFFHLTKGIKFPTIGPHKDILQEIDIS